MKTDTFNFSRLGLLFQRFFAIRLRYELISWCIMAIVFMFFRNNIPAMSALIIISGIIYASGFFKEIHSPANGAAYFMIPASQLEKLTVGIVITSFYYFAGMLIAYTLGNLLGTFFNNMLAGMNLNILPGFNLFHHSPLQWSLFGISIEPWVNEGEHANFLFHLFKLFLYGQSIYLLGSIYFKRHRFLVTFLSLNIVMFFLLILLVIESKLFLGTANVQFNEFGINGWGETAGNILRYFLYLIPPFFWIVSYFRLTEKQV